MPPYPITRAEISRTRLVENFRELRSLARRGSYGNRRDLLAVVKADAYGHGVGLCAPWLVEAGAQWLGVTSVGEGTLVRRGSPEARILVMCGLQAADPGAILDARLTPTVWTLEHLQILKETLGQQSLRAGSLPIHLEIDTGMSRQGVSFAAAEIAAVLDRLRTRPALRLDGVFTHFASPEVLDAEQNSQQMSRFRQAVEQIAAAGFRPQWIHAGNSSTLLGQRQIEPLVALAKSVDASVLLRPGIALYGYALPFVGGRAEMPTALKPVLAWKTKIVSMRTVEAGARIGYSGTLVAPTMMRLALLPVGYADGVNRKLSNRGHVLVRGTSVPIVGRVSMDLTIVDVSNVANPSTGDEVVLLGEQNGGEQGCQRITANDHALWAETIPHEILCSIGARVPRVGCE
jgi:alanine racemase